MSLNDIALTQLVKVKFMTGSMPNISHNILYQSTELMPSNRLLGLNLRPKIKKYMRERDKSICSRQERFKDRLQEFGSKKAHLPGLLETD